MMEKESERVKRRKKTRDDAMGKGKEKEREAESEEAEEEENVSERLDCMEKNMKEMLVQQKEVITQQGWLKRQVEMIWKDTDDIRYFSLLESEFMCFDSAVALFADKVTV
jgi:hypothetical protein